jgi:3-phenylpropionate/trans-cinnamate dioxygenase ferredoxin reductase component
MPERGRNRTIVIAGAGLAGGTAAKTLREEGYSDRLILIGDEPGLPFGRPPLSKSYLRGEENLSSWLVEPKAWYTKHKVELWKDRVETVDVAAKKVRLDSGAAVAFSKLLIATGGRNRRFSVQGADLAGVFQLRSVAECDAIKTASKAGNRVIVVGMGFIGCEVAASLRQLGLEVTVILHGKAPLIGVLGPEMGNVIAGIHRDAGVKMVAEDEVVRFEGKERVGHAITKSGRRIPCDLAVAAVGIEPNVDALRGTGMPIRDGILVDATCRSSVPGIFAAGDVASQLHPIFGRVRVEHYNNAEKQAAAAARSMLGSRAQYRYIHSFWSDQFEHKLEYVGHARKWDRFVVRGSLKERYVVGFYLNQGRLVAAVGLNRGGDPEKDPDGELAKSAMLIARRAKPAAARLADEQTDLATL